MRYALLFAIRLLISAIVLAYVLAMLSASCLPVADPGGQVQAIPRWEYWLLHVSMPSAIWWQWTGGLQPIVVSDRLPILGLSSLWIAGCYWVGRTVARLDPLAIRLNRYEQIGVSLLVGHAALAMFVFLGASTIGTALLPAWLLVLLVALLLQSRLWHKHQSIAASSDRPSDQEFPAELDPSFSSSINRRMVGLLFISTTFLAAIQVYGATIPTQDLQVRDTDWWMTKHAALDGRLGWSADHAMVNAPAGFNMPSVCFASFLTRPMPRTDGSSQTALSVSVTSIEARERMCEYLKTCVLAGKTVNAILCLVGIFLASVHLGKQWGMLVGLIVAMMLLSTPGIAELTRLGRTEALVGVWGVALLVLFQTSRDVGWSRHRAGPLWGCLIAGALGAGYGAALIVALPAIAFMLIARFIRTREGNSVSKTNIASKLIWAVLAIAAIAPYLRNAIASGDPVSPWGSVLMHGAGIIDGSATAEALLYAHRVPSQTIDEVIEETNFETTALPSNQSKSPYRLVNVFDGLFRLLGNSNVHGLMMIPFAIVGCFVGRMESKKFAVAWALTWMIAWWLISTRQDRDWVGALLLLAWPAAAGANWIAGIARGYYLFVLVAVSIAWSIVVIPIWPTSDNRNLIALNQFDRGPMSVPGSEDEKKGNNLESYSIQFNKVLRNSKVARSKPKVLLIGESDDFEILADCASNGPFDACLLDEWKEMTVQEIGTRLRKNGFTHLLLAWSGVRYRGKLTGRDREVEYRSTVSKLLNESQLQAIPWEINSSEAELFLVKEE